MLTWVEKVLAPYVMTAPEDIILLLVLDKPANYLRFLAYLVSVS